MDINEIKQAVDTLSKLWTQAVREHEQTASKHGMPSVEEMQAWSVRQRLGQAYESAWNAWNELQKGA